MIEPTNSPPSSHKFFLHIFFVPFNGNELKCPSCHISFQNIDNTIEHINNNHNCISHTFRCLFCLREWHNLNQALVHIKKVHYSTIIKPPTSTSIITTNSNLINKHNTIITHSISSPISSTINKSNSSTIYKPFIFKYPFNNNHKICSYCQSSYSSFTDLILHHKKFHNINNHFFQCRLCNKNCRSLELIKDHVINIHSYHRSPRNDNNLPSSSSLSINSSTSHIPIYTSITLPTLIHTPISIPTLPRITPTSHHSYTFSIPFDGSEKKCSMCPSSFQSHNNTIRHYKQLHNITSFIFQCKFCKKTMARSKKHKHTHL